MLKISQNIVLHTIFLCVMAVFQDSQCTTPVPPHTFLGQTLSDSTLEIYIKNISFLQEKIKNKKNCNPGVIKYAQDGDLIYKALYQENAEDIFRVGMLYFEFGDNQEAVLWFTLAKNKGHAAAENNIGWMKEHGLGGLKKDERAARICYQNAAQLGDARAYFNLGLMEEHGRGGRKKNEEAAKIYYQKAADLGYSKAQYKVGMMYEKGLLGTEKNEKEAYLWYKKCADQKELI